MSDRDRVIDRACSVSWHGMPLMLLTTPFLYKTPNFVSKGPRPLYLGQSVLNFNKRPYIHGIHGHPRRNLTDWSRKSPVHMLKSPCPIHWLESCSASTPSESGRCPMTYQMETNSSHVEQQTSHYWKAFHSWSCCMWERSKLIPKWVQFLRTATPKTSQTNQITQSEIGPHNRPDSSCK